jgi:aldehyde:ferredoxin oxidoreductase
LLPRVVATRGSEKKDYDPRILITTALSFATEPRRPIQQLHEIATLAIEWLGGPFRPEKPGAGFTAESLRTIGEKMWGSAAAADFSTYEGKALAAKLLQDRALARECVIFCDLRWMMTQIPRALGAAKDTVTEAQIYSAVTGKETDDAEFARIGERIFNLQRAILLRQGWGGRKGDDILGYYFTEPLKKNEIFFNAEGLIPGKDGEIVSKIGATLDRGEFEKMKAEYYGYRGWDAATGYPTKAKLDSLQLQDVAEDLAKRGLVR